MSYKTAHRSPYIGPLVSLLGDLTSSRKPHASLLGARLLTVCPVGDDPIP